MVFKNLPKAISKCPVCGINEYKMKDGSIKPMIWPCGVGLFRENNLKKKDRQVCPYESQAKQLKMLEVMETEKIAGLLGTIHGDSL